MQLNALAIIAALASSAVATPLPSSDGNVTALEARILDNDAQSILCITATNSKCGVWFSYAHAGRRESTNYQTGGSLACSVELLRKHCNSAGFCSDIDIISRTGGGGKISYNNKEIALGVATWSNNDQAHMNARCLNEFGWGNVDVSKSGETYWGDLSTTLW